MTNRKLSDWDRVQTQLWMGSLMQESGIQRPEHIAEYLASKLQLDRHDFTSFKLYARGKQHAGRGRGPNAYGEWVELAARVWPATWAWFMNPLYFLQQNKELTFDDLLACARSLPQIFRENLVPPAHAHSPLALCVSHLPRDLLYALTDPVNPWSLGALACAMRRAELAGDPGTMRWAGVGILWAIDYFLEATHLAMHLPLKELRGLVTTDLNNTIYPGQFVMRAPVTSEDVHRFDRERQRFVDYFAEGEFGSWEPGTTLPWIEKGC
ncbi:MAG: hypothetical protein B7X65_22885 [Polaromonas sp. 39-63-25]|nr:MAG: hypothetical protein B7Y60_23325 [Polaromonas sp. 35-63-35]OYZ15007.1 MAG: hypothetical protein B7Y28_22815 [Polaromonas sp. 16-63-31]OYZ75422.1 MAG: hypothetical protein B7Y09_24220 [Polaromonas sp. 24-63-21]OZA85093.1 MAG: hypothetical protein B7X65_22885 [Polaromonas sp. 39-63-25]